MAGERIPSRLGPTLRTISYHPTEKLLLFYCKQLFNWCTRVAGFCPLNSSTLGTRRQRDSRERRTICKRGQDQTLTELRRRRAFTSHSKSQRSYPQSKQNHNPP